MNNLRYSLNDKKVQSLASTDQALSRLINFLGNCELSVEEDGFKCLTKYIIGQQISDKARETIWQRMCSNISVVTPETVLSTDDSVFRKIGLPQRKVEYIKILAMEILNGGINFNEFRLLSNQEIRSQLTTLKGIGTWTADMYLMFSLGRENVFASGDGTIKRAIQWMYGLEQPPSKKKLSDFFDKWVDEATIVSAYLWKATELDLLQKPFDSVIPMEGTGI